MQALASHAEASVLEYTVSTCKSYTFSAALASLSILSHPIFLVISVEFNLFFQAYMMICSACFLSWLFQVCCL